LAEGILQHKADNLFLGWTVHSAGTSGWHAGSRPDKRSIEVAEKHGVDISHQRARPFYPKDFEAYDHIFVMDKSNYENVLSMADKKVYKSKVSLILDVEFPGQGLEVPDPYYGTPSFQEVYNMLDSACEAIINKYRADRQG
jgi:protein-tyrosine phosphatase